MFRTKLSLQLTCTSSVERLWNVKNQLIKLQKIYAYQQIPQVFELKIRVEYTRLAMANMTSRRQKLNSGGRVVSPTWDFGFRILIFRLPDQPHPPTDPCGSLGKLSCQLRLIDPAIRPDIFWPLTTGNWQCLARTHFFAWNWCRV